jgi:signal peptidase II
MATSKSSVMTDTTLMSWLWGRWSALGLCLALVTFVVDQAHKWWVVVANQLPLKGRVEVLPFLDYVYIVNKGISYGMLPLDSRGGQIALCAFAVVASVGLAVWLARGATNRLMAVSIGLIIGGALGNALDRLNYGGVADYFSLHAFGFYWYVFNIADVAIVAGAAGLLYELIVSSRNPA